MLHVRMSIILLFPIKNLKNGHFQYPKCANCDAYNIDKEKAIMQKTNDNNDQYNKIKSFLGYGI